jgi:glycosyltransferase involved in cell wall biosynthesis
VIGHLREVKDPLRTLRALQYVGRDLEVIQVGELLEPELKPKSADPRYRWLGSVPHARALRWLASSHAMVISSSMEGGANVVCEALRIGVPVLASRISGNVGLLGERYAGYFKVGDARDLARLIEKSMEKPFYGKLKTQVARLRPTVAPRSEARALLASVQSLSRSPRARRRP